MMKYDLLDMAPLDRVQRVLGERLDARRIALGLRHEDLRHKTGVSGTALNRLFHGEGSSLATLLAVLRVLGLQERLLDLLPEQAEGPVARMARPAKQPRQRVRGFAEPSKPWVWGDKG